MKRFSRFATFAACVAFATGIGTTTVIARAQPLPQRQLSRGATDTERSTPPPKGPRLVYGTIRSVKGAALVLQTRRGTLTRVDAAPAMAAGTYSAPLFVGKIVAVSGFYDAAHVLHARSVTRMTRLDATTGPDR